MKKMKEFLEWLAEVKELVGGNYDYVAELYSFEGAYEEGFSPRRAVEDSQMWLGYLRAPIGGRRMKKPRLAATRMAA